MPVYTLVRPVHAGIERRRSRFIALMLPMAGYPAAQEPLRDLTQGQARISGGD
nr:hypothetical protein [uncultured Noviherbaspirillum sp.]